MSPDDPRHGTYAGWQQHNKTDDPTCEPCRVAQRRYFKAMKYRLHVAGPERIALGEDAWSVIDSMGREELSRLTGFRGDYLSRLRHAGPEKKVYRRTRERILSAGAPVTPTGVQRRLRALFALGYSGARLASEVGMSVDGMRQLLKSPKPRNYHPAHVTDAVVDAYNRLGLKPMPAGAAAVASRNRATRYGWATPLAWDAIDDPNEHPRGWQYSPATRLETFTELVERGAGVSELCRHLGLTRAALQKWTANNALSAEFRAACGREHNYSTSANGGAA